jgi:hypothetical protein
VAFGDHRASVRVTAGRADLTDRLRLAEDWPATTSPGFEDGFAGGVADPATGTIGYAVANPPVAARLALLETLPFGVCDEVVPIPDPTGL